MTLTRSWPGLTVVLLCMVSFVLARLDSAWLALWPSCVALLIVFITRSALIGLLCGAFSGAVLLAEGQLGASLSQLWFGQFWPIFGSEWKVSAIVFTLVLGGFVALIEAGGGLQNLVHRLLGVGQAPAKRMQMTVLGFGLLVFFDGLANTMLIGRLLRTAADQCGVSREKLAYLADTTGSAVACLAFVSTWIAFQLSMIQEGLAQAGVPGSAYGLFFKSLPTNFYCWFTLLLALICIAREFNPGPMGRLEKLARKRLAAGESSPGMVSVAAVHWLWAIVPILVLTLSIPVITYCIGSEAIWPFSLAKFAAAYGVAEAFVPQILVASSVTASLVAGVAWCLNRRSGDSHRIQVVAIFLSGVKDLFGPICILLAAWMLGNAIHALGAAGLLGDLLQGRLHIGFFPAVIFALGALISFSTGTSWGTMGVLMPLAIPVILSLSGELSDLERERTIVAAIGAVFSGAVFGDHCSPFSDTTIVASIASGVEPIDHVRTQMPFAMIAGGVAVVFGFIPLGFGFPVWGCLLLGAVMLLLVPTFRNLFYANTN